jgi:cytochrome bd-type quinol oxidase subunit 1
VSSTIALSTLFHYVFVCSTLGVAYIFFIYAALAIAKKDLEPKVFL